MHPSFKLTLTTLLTVILAAGTGTAAGQVGLSYERGAGLGLKPPASIAATSADLVFGGEATQVWQTLRASDYGWYGGVRDTLRPDRPGLKASESYGGVVYPLGNSWATSFEAGLSPESPFAPQRYTLVGQLHTAFSGGGISIGLKYRGYGPESASGAYLETTPANGYTLTPYRLPTFAPAPGYQFQMSYQYSAAGTFGLAMGREVETFTPFADPALAGSRQFSFTGQHWLTPSWALSYDLLSHDVATPLRVQGLRLGVRYRF